MKLLILDLDETLIYASESPIPEKPPDFEMESYAVYLRPHLNHFLNYCQEHFEVAVWTSANELYAQNIIQKIFPINYPLSFAWSRQKCTPHHMPHSGEINYRKKLSKLKKNYSLKNIIVIDDSPEKHTDNYGNLVLVNPYYGDSEDNELVHLIKYLDTLKDQPDIRAIEKRGWKNKITQHKKTRES